MKYFNFKRYKFVTFLDNINFKLKKLYNKKYNFSIPFKYNDIKNFFIRLYISTLNSIKKNIISFKRKKFVNYKVPLIYVTISIIFSAFIYIFIPTFYNYDKSIFEKKICISKNFKCSIAGKINYNFYPSPRIKIKDILINDNLNNELIIAEEVAIKLSLKNLIYKVNQNYKNVQLNNFKINFDLNNFTEYKKIQNNKKSYLPITLKNGEILLSDNKKYIATIYSKNFKITSSKNMYRGVLKGDFLNDRIFIDITSNDVGDNISTDIILKATSLNLLTKANIFSSKKNSNPTTGNILIKKDKNRITSIFEYKDNKFFIKDGNIKNTFLNGKLGGVIKLKPFFNFDLNLNLKGFNFNKFINIFYDMNDEEKNNMFVINNKINGQLKLSADKIYSKYNLFNSFESEMRFFNGKILIERLLFNLEKFGAADFIGELSQDKNKTTLKFENNIFVDNSKVFYRKFGIYDQKSDISNLFISGRFDLTKKNMTFSEIFNEEKIEDNEVAYIEKQFNEILLEEGYKSLFNFVKLKSFVQLMFEE